MSRTVIVVGHGMVGHRFVEELRTYDKVGDWNVVVVTAEKYLAYDRVSLSSYFDGKSAQSLSLVGNELAQDPFVKFRTSTKVVSINRGARTVRCDDGETLPYDALVLATGSAPFVPPVPGYDLPGCFVYRTLDDLDAIQAAAEKAAVGVVIGGGVLGLEAANALRLLGLRAHVVEAKPRLMPLQVDEQGGEILLRLVSRLNVTTHLGSGVRGIESELNGRVRQVHLDDGTTIDTDLVIFSAGIRARDELADTTELSLGPQGGFLVDRHCRTADEHVWAIGECAAVDGDCYGLVAPGYRMAEVVAAQLLGDDQARFAGVDMSVKLKLLGVDVAAVGDVHAWGAGGALEFSSISRTSEKYSKLVLDGDGRTLLGGLLVGDASAYPKLRSLLGQELPSSAEALLTPS